MEEETKRRREIESRLLEKVEQVISAVKAAKHVDQVICALHSLAILLFPLDSSLFSGSMDQRYRDQVLGAIVPSEKERSVSFQVFYHGVAFPALARVLLFDVACNWLPCFPFSAQKHVYDVFFVNGVINEVVQVLVPCLQQNRTDGHDVDVFLANIERLLVLCLIENDGVLKMAQFFGNPNELGSTLDGKLKNEVSRVVQIVASIPDKARLTASPALSSHSFFKQITIQLLSGVEGVTISCKDDLDGTLLFIGETFSRICRRGSSDVLLSEVTPQILRYVQNCLSSSSESGVGKYLNESNNGSQFWMRLMEAIVDPYAMERISEQLLNQLVAEDASDVEAYWTLWLLFNRLLKYQTTARYMFVDKFLLWKVFPVCCLRWILQFAVLECPPVTLVQTEGRVTNSLLETVQHLAAVWSKKEFVQSVPVEQQAYVTAGIGICLEKMSKEELDKTKDLMHSILQGVSIRLESPAHLVRKMASSIALAFSKVIDPKNPLYLDDANCNEDTIDWEFGLTATKKGILSISNGREKEHDGTGTSTASELADESNYKTNYGVDGNKKSQSKKLSALQFVDPDEIIDPAMLNMESVSDDDNISENSDSSSDSSLQPYDLTDDDKDLKRKFSQLVDVVGALRKSDDADGVERALDVAESLVRASPDELTHVAGDLVRILVQIRCSDLAAEGEEDSAEEKRQRALVALAVTCPFESLDTLNKLLYSPNVDISQRIMILDVMTEAAQELAHAKVKKSTLPRQGNLISSISDPQPWFLPSNSGPLGASSWKEMSGTGTPLNWSKSYERDLPLKPGQTKKGQTRRRSVKSENLQNFQIDSTQNKFPVYAAAFMLPAMEGFDKRRQGVDLLGRDFIVLGKLIYMLGVCMKCSSMHPEASALAPPLLDMLRVREICHHKEAYVRKAVLFAASCVLLAIHPSHVASALIEGNIDLANGLEWIRGLALEVADSDTDKECYTMAMTCLQLHAEMALQASRAMECGESTSTAKSVISLPSGLSKATIKIPFSSVEY